MTDKAVTFSLDGTEVVAPADKSLWQIAFERGNELPHLCHKPAHGYRPDGNCRLCLVEIEGERTLAASCIRKPQQGMRVRTNSDRVMAARQGVMSLLLDQAEVRPGTEFERWAKALGVPFQVTPQTSVDSTNPAISFDDRACITCGLCERACGEVQVNKVIGLAGRGHETKVVFDLGDPMGESSCVSCGECVQACPTGALQPSKGRRATEWEINSLCPYCGVGCQVTYKGTGQRLQRAEGRDGPANRGRLCVKGRFGFDYAQHAHRLCVPLIRREDAPKGKECVIDPANPFTHFRQASWDEALEAAALGFEKILTSRGGSALAGFGSAKGSNEEAYLVQKLVRQGFGTNNVDHCTRLCHASSVAALMETIGSGAVTAPVRECLNSEVIVVIGSNPTVNHPVAATFIKNAVEDHGAKLVVMDPRGQALSRHATHMLRFRGSTDVALLNALMHVIAEEGLVNQGYIDRYTEGWDGLRAHLSAFSPERMAPICGIDVATLREVARLIGKSRATMIFWGMGVSQHSHGTDNARCLISLALMCGQVGRRGAGLHPLRGQNNVQGASDCGLIPMVYPDYRSVEDKAARAFYEELWQTKLSPTKGLTVVEILNAAKAKDIAGLYIMGENPAMSDPDLNHAREALASLEHLVVQDIFLTETAWHADVVLPASSFFEKDGTFTNTDRLVQRGRAMVAPPGEAKQDWWIVQELAKRLGLGWDYQAPSDIFAEMRKGLGGFAGISWGRLAREDAVTHPCPSETEPGREILFKDGFPTPLGKGKFVPADILAPDEVPDKDYPMILSTGRVLEHWHTGAMTRRAEILDELEPEAFAMVSLEDFTALGLEPGEMVKLQTRRGEIDVMARADRDVPMGMVFMPFCFVEAAANLLTNPVLDPFGKIPEFKFCAVRVVAPERRKV